MAVLRFKASGKDNCVTVAGTPYMFARTALGSFVLPVRCPHRGGPLNLGVMRATQARIVCPWHDRSTSVTRALRRGIPAVRRGDLVTMVMVVPDGAGHELEHRPVSPSLAVGS